MLQKKLNLGFRHHVCGKVVTSPAVFHCSHGLEPLVREGDELQGNIKRPPCHLWVVDAPPQMFPIWHVAVLACALARARSRIRTGQPLRIGVFLQLTGNTGAILRELMTM